jgi:hypothetical protein
VELAFVSALLAKTVRSSTLKHALIWIGIFGAVVLALFGYVYWATASYVRSRSDGTIEAERRILQEAYARTGREGLISAIERRIAEQRFDGLYLLADPAFAAVGGNLKTWPLALDRLKGWDSFMRYGGQSSRRCRTAITCWSAGRSTISMSSPATSGGRSCGASF